MKNYGFSVSLFDRASAGLRRISSILEKTQVQAKALSNAPLLSKVPTVVQSLAGLESKMSGLTEKRNLAVSFSEAGKINAELDRLQLKVNSLQTARPIGLRAGIEQGVNQKAQFIQGGGLNTVTTVAAAGAMYAYANYAKDSLARVAELDDRMAGAAKTTGLSKIEVKALSNELQKINTRTKIDDLLGIGEIAGQFKTPKAEIANFVKSVDQAAVAFKKEFGTAEKTADVFGKMGTVWAKAFPSDQIAERITKIGSGVNELTMMGAKANNITDFALRFAPAMNQLKPETILAWGAGLEKMGTDSEIASSGLQTFFKSVFSNSDRFASLMGINEKSFRQMLNTDEGVRQFMSNFSKITGKLDMEQQRSLLTSLKVDDQQAQRAVLGMVELQRMAAADSGKYSNALTELYDKAGRGIAEGTSLTNEFNLMNNTAAARIEKFWKKADEVTIKFGESLLPTLDRLLDFASTFNIDTAVNGLKAFGIAIGIIGTAFLAYSAYTTIAAISTLGFAAALQATGIPIIVIGLTALTAGIIWAYYEFDTFRSVVDTVGSAIMSVVDAIGEVYNGFVKLFAFVGNSSFFENIGKGFAEIGKMMGIEPTAAVTQNVPKTPTVSLPTDQTGFLGKAGQVAGGLFDKMPAAAQTKVSTVAEKIGLKTPKSLTSPTGGNSMMADKFLADQTSKEVAKKAGQGVVGGEGKVTNITINMQNLVGTISISATNIQEGSDDIQARVEEALLRALHGTEAKVAQ